ncbi:MAG TPA: hypothetical protein VG429_12710 [Casimicrobiaceae bacterium]|jgi:hypothetical protein|nr:hypothetical protein [Casimicrobiaceae bacterium]
MAEPIGSRASDTKMDATSLYREEIYTDRAAGTLRVLVPVKVDGTTDNARATIFVGEAQILTNMGPLPISFEVEARTLAEAVENYGEAAKSGVERAVRELQEMRRQASSSIVLPGAGAAAGLGGGLPPGGLGGGKIKLP